MIRRSLLAITTLAALGVSSSAFATVAATNTNVQANQQDAVIPITYTTRAGIGAAGFDANVVDAGNIVVDGSEVFQVFDALGATFVNCDGNPQTVASQTTITCSANGVYSVTKNNGTDLQTLTNAMRVLVDIVPAAADGLTATVEFGPYCTGVQTPAADGCTAFFLLDSNRDNNPAQPVANNGTITVAGVPDPLTLTVPASLPAFPAGNVGATSAPQQLTVTATGNQGTASLANCTGPAGITVGPPNTLTFNAAGNQSLNVTCTYGAAAINGNIACTETDDNSAGTTTNIAVSCPAGAVVPVQPTIVTTSPAPNSNTNLPAGNAGQTVTASNIINFTNVGGAGGLSSTISCAAAGAVTIAPSGQQTVTGAAQPVDISVSCLLTAAVQNGSVTCTIDDLATDRTETFNFTCPAGATVFPPSQPSVIPASSLWTKIGLFGLLAVLGALVIGFRRHS